MAESGPSTALAGGKVGLNRVMTMKEIYIPILVSEIIPLHSLRAWGKEAHSNNQSGSNTASGWTFDGHLCHVSCVQE